MHNELRYQAKTYTISEKLSKEKKKIHIFSPIYLFIYLFLSKTNKQKNNKDMLIEKEMTHGPSM
jgi:hypothetical protein